MDSRRLLVHVAAAGAITGVLALMLWPGGRGVLGVHVVSGAMADMLAPAVI